MMTESDLMREIISHRKALLAYILVVVKNYHLAEDVFQEVCLILTKRRTEFVEVPDFWRLARGIAWRQSFVALRRGKKQFALSPEAMEKLETSFDEIQTDAESREKALLECIQQLPDAWKKIVQLRYWSDRSVNAIATELGKTANTVSVTMNRIRRSLVDCVNGTRGNTEEVRS